MGTSFELLLPNLPLVLMVAMMLMLSFGLLIMMTTRICLGPVKTFLTLIQLQWNTMTSSPFTLLRRSIIRRKQMFSHLKDLMLLILIMLWWLSDETVVLRAS